MMLKNLKVLLVEDNEFNRLVAEDTLREEIPGIEIQIAYNGKDAFAHLENELFDLVLMDILMPVMDGLTATRLIRQLPRPACDLPIIAMTANFSENDVTTCYDAGMDALIPKPFDPHELLQTINSVRSGAFRKTVVPDHTHPASVTNLLFLHKFTEGDPGKIKKYINLVLNTTPDILLRLEAALKEKDHRAIRSAAHSLRPQLNFMGIKEDASRVAYLEALAENGAEFSFIEPFVVNLSMVCEKAFEELSHCK